MLMVRILQQVVAKTIWRDDNGGVDGELVQKFIFNFEISVYKKATKQICDLIALHKIPTMLIKWSWNDYKIKLL